MVLTTFPTDVGSAPVQVRILADTICELGAVSKGQLVNVSFQDWIALRNAGKAELCSKSDNVGAAVDAAAQQLTEDAVTEKKAKAKK